MPKVDVKIRLECLSYIALPELPKTRARDYENYTPNTALKVYLSRSMTRVYPTNYVEVTQTHNIRLSDEQFRRFYKQLKQGIYTAFVFDGLEHSTACDYAVLPSLEFKQVRSQER